MKIAVAGCGYVGLANALLLAQHHEVVAVDTVAQKVALLNDRQCPIPDAGLSDWLENRALNFRATLDCGDAFAGAQYVIIATPTDFDAATQRIDTRSVDAVIRNVLAVNLQAVIVIKSTVPVGYTAATSRALGIGNLLCSPEFLREGRALDDVLHPPKIVVGGQTQQAREFATLLAEGATRKDVPIVLTGSSEAEAIKLFGNTYLAMRIAFFNELDSFAVTHGLDARQVISAVCKDPRVGDHYNNPSFGYGGHCLPKDAMQLLADSEATPHTLIRSIVESNAARKDFVAEQILRREPKVVGIYRLAAKSGSDSVRGASIQGVMKRISTRGVEVIVHEPLLAEASVQGCRVVSDLAAFKARADIIVANRMDPQLQDVAAKVYTRDLFGNN